MKKAYAAPVLMTSDSIVRATLSGNSSASEDGTFKSLSAGSVGYYV
jgi:hypothetical protein